MLSLRQKTYGVFIRPYIVYGSDRLVQRGSLYVVHPCQGNSSTTVYAKVEKGSAWMLYNDEYLTSFALVRERVKEIMDTLGISKEDIRVCEITPVDNIVTPLA